MKLFLLLRRDRLVTLVGLLLLLIFSWLYIIYLYKQMYPMNMDALFFAMPMTANWTLTDFALLFVMWIVMMVAMMTPGVAPLILIFVAVSRRHHDKNPLGSSWFLIAGYFFVWCAFSLLATLLQWMLQKISLLNPEMETTNKVLQGIILIIAGTFQFTSLKWRCLKFCQSPLSFLQRFWKHGNRGALKIGMLNGIYCVGCCWTLMIVLFVSGVMNILWIAIIAIFILIEKLFPRTRIISYSVGALLIVSGIVCFVN